MEKILLAGATGYLGGYILPELLKKGYQTKILVRNKHNVIPAIEKSSLLEIQKVTLTNKSSVDGCCKGYDVVISTVGITKQKDGFSYMDVDYQANLNLLNEAKNNGVKKFIYVSVLNGKKLTNLAICNAKEKFVDALKASGLDYCIIRPNGFFSDMAEFYHMANKGRIYLFGDGNLEANPIHGIDLAKECVNQINDTINELEIGGPQTLTQNTIAKIAFTVSNKEPKITHIPDWVRVTILTIGKVILPKQRFGPIEFFMTVMAIEMVAPEYGNHTLESYFKKLKSVNKT